ncbi:helicase-related protein [Tenacibaculum piscium]|uniref:Helicase n=1 Tax=Tenacibaculum piscium TaxID=1458515 RepID=A0A2H1YJ04_9FLAO|nr:helicase-related protein [Tenacibaculum piscium]MBE7628581.1 DEAD/DEAH box helicase family protein [Tenacibaculum piscium]MBE7669722.1 DEAD/DEAH box helicase family protein [Tenacibaculum piscium]MBE7684690.1 DEAD/DEAH box helicase family protein [Tenacibaculum piscium]SOS75371.1 Helicase [Tenacibaculum piscium]
MSNNFITNNSEATTLKNRLEKLISASKELKFLVGFFYFSGWQEIYKKLEENRDITLKILVGLQVDKYLSSIVEVGIKDASLSQEEHFSQFMKSMGFAINNSEMDNEEFYNQLSFFIELLENGRLIIRKTLNPNHAKVYLFGYKTGLSTTLNSKGQFITGSSNLTKSGLSNQEEFNVEIKDYGFSTAELYFDNLWETAVPITESENGTPIIIDFLKNKSQASLITPFEAYALILKTYIELQEAKKINDSITRLLEENGFEKYQYQLDSVSQALKIIEVYNGVIIADVVGLGKSVIASLIANQIGKRGLILCPPGLIGNKKENSGWWEYWNRFKLYNWDIESSGNVEAVCESILKNNLEYEVIIIDEAHRFRNQDTSAYEALLDICRGKQVILLTATPFNNSPIDIFSLLKLFIVPGASGITLESDLEGKFNKYNSEFKRLSNIIKNHNANQEEKRAKARKDYLKIFGDDIGDDIGDTIDILKVKRAVSKMANEIKNSITPVVIRRNRLDLKTDFEYKKEIDNLSKVKDPEEQFYELSSGQSDFYNRIIRDYFSETGNFKGAIYKPNEYETLKENKNKLSEDDNRAFQQQRNLFDFMRRLLVKRFESSFGAFEKSIQRFLRTNKMVLSFIEKSGKYVLDRKVIENIYDDSDDADDFTYEAIKETLEEFERNAVNKTKPKHTKIYDIDTFEFKKEFINDIKNDIKLFEKIQQEIHDLNIIKNDPKREAVLKTIKEVLAKEINQEDTKNQKKPRRKIILFTEYTDTVRHLKKYFEKELLGRAMFCDGGITKKFAKELDANFNAKYDEQVDDFDVLITSDKLSEGFNLNRAGLIINYDIPWNPTRVIQRVGRINRMSAKVFDELFIYNFFPTDQGADIVKSKEIAQQKMFLIHSALGEDSKIFDADEEPTPSGLFNKISKNPEENEELSIHTIIRNDYNEILKSHPAVIKKINDLPNRVKTAKLFNENNVVVLRKKGMALFSIVHQYENEKPTNKPTERTFEELINFVKCDFDEIRQPLNSAFWNSYEEIKTYKPKYKSGRSELAHANQAKIALKTVLKVKRNDLNQELISFIDTLLKDITKYKTLPTNTLRKLSLKNKNYKTLIENIIDLRRRLGDDYLNVILSRIDTIENDVIIAVGNMESRE